jgi:hypothetical protein
VHARNLNDFFSKRNNRADDSEATDFATSDYTPTDYGPIPQDLYNKINWQISHITKNRTEDGKELIGTVRRREILLAVLSEIHRFSPHVRPEFRGVWKWKSQEEKLQVPRLIKVLVEDPSDEIITEVNTVTG